MLPPRPAYALLRQRELLPLLPPGVALLPRRGGRALLLRAGAFLLQPDGELLRRRVFELLLQHANAPRPQRVDALPLRLAVALLPPPACARLRPRHVCAPDPVQPCATSQLRDGTALLPPRVGEPLLRRACALRVRPERALLPRPFAALLLQPCAGVLLLRRACGPRSPCATALRSPPSAARPLRLCDARARLPLAWCPGHRPLVAMLLPPRAAVVQPPRNGRGQGPPLVFHPEPREPQPEPLE